MRKQLLLLLSVFCLAPVSFAASEAAQGASAGEREYIYGAELLTPQERERYRRGLRAEPDDDARGRYRERHRDRLQQRARQRGVQLDERGIIRRYGVER